MGKHGLGTTCYNSMYQYGFCTTVPLTQIQKDLNRSCDVRKNAINLVWNYLERMLKPAIGGLVFYSSHFFDLLILFNYYKPGTDVQRMYM